MASKKSDKTAKSKAKSTPGKRGGARPGAGRPTKEVTKLKAEANLACVTTITPWVPDLLKSLRKLALGGYKRVTQTREPAGLVMREVPSMDNNGEPRLNPFTGAPLLTKVPAYPDKDPDELVIVSERIEVADGDRQAAGILLDRVAGKSVLAIEVSGADGGAIPVSIESRIATLWGEKTVANSAEECDS